MQSRTGKYRGLQGNPCNENRIPAMRTGFPVRIDLNTGSSLSALQGLGLQCVIYPIDKAEQIHKMITVFTQNGNFFHPEPF